MIARHDADEVLAHLARDVGHHRVTVGEFHAELRVGEGFHNVPLDFNRTDWIVREDTYSLFHQSRNPLICHLRI